MKSSKVSEKHRVTLSHDIKYDYNPHDIGSYSVSKFLRAVEDIDGVLEVVYDMADKKSFFVTIDQNYCWQNVVEFIRTLSEE